MPGFTHLQSAQPVTLGHHLMAYDEMIARDRSRFADARAPHEPSAARRGGAGGDGLPDRPRCDGGGAGGSTGRPRNSLDSVSDRDFAIDYLTCAVQCSLHLSRLAEEFVLWASQPFGFVSAVPINGRPAARSCRRSATPTPPSWCAAMRAASSAA